MEKQAVVSSESQVFSRCPDPVLAAIAATAIAVLLWCRPEGIITVCSHCRRLRDEKSVYQRMEVYFQKKFHFTFSHGICPDCMKQHYPE